MAVTPILQSINAFDVTAQNYEEMISGAMVYYCAIVSFSVSASAEFIKSNRITIYDSESGEVVATHTYNGEALVNKIPTNLSGISNGNYYYATIEIFDQANATGNTLGISNAKQFWCLPTPDLNIVQPSSDVHDYAYSDYNFVAEFIMYDEQFEPLASEVTNKIQSYQFELYKGTYSSSVLQRSGEVIFNTGATIDNNQYTINYIFASLESGSTYFAKVKITTEQGMVVEAISHLIEVNSSPISFSVAKVTNKSCDGYIEIQSNITNIVGYTDADYNIGDGFIDLRGNGKFASWGYNVDTGQEEYSIHFPYSNDGYVVNSKWSFFIAGKDFRESILTPLTDTRIPQEKILTLRDYQEINECALYYRDDGTDVWFDFYAYRNDGDDINGDMLYTKSNTLSKSDVTDDTMLYILIRCYDGWYDVLLSDTL